MRLKVLMNRACIPGFYYWSILHLKCGWICFFDLFLVPKDLHTDFGRGCNIAGSLLAIYASLIVVEIAKFSSNKIIDFPTHYEVKYLWSLAHAAVLLILLM